MARVPPRTTIARPVIRTHRQPTQQQAAQNSQTEQHSSGEAKKAPDISGMIMNHIGDANEFHLWGHTSISLPCLVYHFNHGFEFFSSGVFNHGHNSYNGYVMQHGRLYFVNDPSFQKAGSVEVHVIDEKRQKTCYSQQRKI
jgi:hypothetical protein